MKLWAVVMQNEGLEGIFSTLEKAQALIAALREPYPMDSFFIEEYELDDPIRSRRLEE